MHSVENGDERPKKEQMLKSKVKALLICLFDVKMVSYITNCASGAYGECRILYSSFRTSASSCVSLELVQNTWVLHYDNAHSHASFVVRQFLTKVSNGFPSHPAVRISLRVTFTFSQNSTSPLRSTSRWLEEIKSAPPAALKGISSEGYRG